MLSVNLLCAILKRYKHLVKGDTVKVELIIPPSKRNTASKLIECVGGGRSG